MGKRPQKLLYLLNLILLCLYSAVFLNSCGTVSALQPPDYDNYYNNAETSITSGNNINNIAAVNNIVRTTEPEEPAQYSANNVAADNAGTDVYEIDPKFESYLKINEDVVGNIKIDGTTIDFPVLFSGENDYYLKHDIYKNESDHGAVFMDMNNHGAILDRNTIIHAHNFEDGTLFSSLEKYTNKEFFDTHKTIIFNNLYSDMVWEVFAVYVVSAEDYYLMTSFADEKQYDGFVDLIKSRALIWSDYTPQPGDYMLTLHTCSYEFKGAHLIIHAKLVKKTDNFEK
ncbi:MAG: class B sortase [Oscillospiraceae bacterium]|nr:class B sortase [Oscillospiraceae bacterium]